MNMQEQPWKTAGRILVAGTLANLLVGGPAGAATVSPPPDIRRDAIVEAVERVMPSVVNIAVEMRTERTDPYYQMLRRYYNWPRESQQSYAVGSGVIIDEEGYLITNYHVVENATRVQVKLSTGEEFETEPLVGTSQRDIVLLKIKNPSRRKFQPMKFAKDDDLLLGETVIAIGNPYGLGGSVTRGILSSKNRRESSGGERLDIPDWLQTDADINPGNSGGPLINLRGELIGINVAVHREAQGMGVGFAIPVRQLNAALAEFFNPEALSALWFGARAGTFEAPHTLSFVQPGSPAEQGGLRAGQKILKINGRAPRNLAEMERLISGGTASEPRAQRQTPTPPSTPLTPKPGSGEGGGREGGEGQINFEIEEGGERRTLSVQLQTFDQLSRQRAGLVFRSLPKELAERIGLSAVILETVEPNSPAARLNLQRGYLVTALDNRPTPHPLIAADILSAKRAGDRLKLSFVVPPTRNGGRYEQYNATLTLR